MMNLIFLCSVTLCCVNFVQGFPPEGMIPGKYQLTTDPMDPNFNEYIKAIGASVEVKEYMKNLSSLEIIREDEKVWTIKRNDKYVKTITNGVEQLIENAADGSNYLFTVIIYGRDMVRIMKFTKVLATCTYTFSPDGIIGICYATGVVAKRNYKRVK